MESFSILGNHDSGELYFLGIMFPGNVTNMFGMSKIFLGTRDKLLKKTFPLQGNLGFPPSPMGKY